MKAEIERNTVQFRHRLLLAFISGGLLWESAIFLFCFPVKKIGPRWGRFLLMKLLLDQ
ncbi:hypothetical protein GWL_09410 [Herbaspirillum sp. GW103]|jgi:hypothetical protein|nr:hypothetical protein GWL_09410 [Herbaspirillum sp. GW103]